ncbi:MAG: hypothetical protein IT233_00315 [Bacteroidia bacterium]|nr:hypothetical protein [Bacteroidia bacterium]
MRWFSGILLLLLFTSCEEKKAFELYTQEFRDIMKSEEGFLRMLEPGMSQQQVKHEEQWALRDEDKNYLFFEQRKKTGEMYTLECTFGPGGLMEIKMDCYLISSGDARNLFNEMKEYYQSRFGESEDYYGFSGWVTDFDGQVVKIELEDESSQYRQGKISLFIYQHIPEAPSKPKG